MKKSADTAGKPKQKSTAKQAAPTDAASAVKSDSKVEEKGKPGRRKGTQKTGGRKKGTPNKATAAARPIIVELIDRLSPEVEAKLQELDADRWLYYYTKLLEYAVPKVSPISAPGTDEADEVKAVVVD